jgi:hypothetical protein
VADYWCIDCMRAAAVSFAVARVNSFAVGRVNTFAVGRVNVHQPTAYRYIDCMRVAAISSSCLCCSAMWCAACGAIIVSSLFIYNCQQSFHLYGRMARSLCLPSFFFPSKEIPHSHHLCRLHDYHTAFFVIPLNNIYDYQWHGLGLRGYIFRA